MMERLIAVFLCIAVVFSLAVIPASAEEEKPTVTVEFETTFNASKTDYEDQNYIFASLRAKPVPVVGQTSGICVYFNGFESFSSGKMIVKYNNETVKFSLSEPKDYDYFCSEDNHSDSMLIDFAATERDYTDFELTEEKDGYAAYIITADGREFQNFYFCYLYFDSFALGEFGFSVEFSDFKDKAGKDIDFDVKISDMPLYTHMEDELPDIPVLDQEKCLTYGMALTMSSVETELAYPMTVGEFIDSVDCDTGYGIIIDRDGNVLDRGDLVPTGSTFKQCYDNSTMFKTTLTVIGDVTCDGKINAADARKILRIAASIENVGNDYARNAILNAANPAQGQSVSIEAKDARAVLRYAAGLEDSYAEWYRYHCLLNKYRYGIYNTNI